MRLSYDISPIIIRHICIRISGRRISTEKFTLSKNSDTGVSSPAVIVQVHQDVAALTGLLRALSFIGLGISPIVIGRFYQRLLTRKAVSQKMANEENE